MRSRHASLNILKIRDFPQRIQIPPKFKPACDIQPIPGLKTAVNLKFHFLPLPRQTRTASLSPASVAQSDVDHEIFSTVTLSLPQIQERELSVSGERIRTTTG